MGSIGGLLGTSGGAGGTGFAGPHQADIQTTVTPEQIAQALKNTGMSLDDQEKLLQVLAAQKGLDLQTQAAIKQSLLSDQLTKNNAPGKVAESYKSQKSLGEKLGNAGGVTAQEKALQKQELLNEGLAGGIGHQNTAVGGLQGVAAQQQGTANQLQGLANGEGLSPSQAQLQQATGQNIRAQGALLAGQRGASANVGQTAKNIAQQGASLQQQSAGQAAELRSKEQLGALQALGTQQQNQGITQQAIGSLGTAQAQLQNQGIGQQAGIGAQITGAEQTAIGQQAAQAAQGVQAAQQAIGAEAGQSNVISGQQIGQVNQNATSALGNQNSILTGVGNQNNAVVNSQGSVNQGNAALANTQLQGQQAILGGVINSAGGASSLLGSGGGARGGYVMGAEGGQSAEMPITLGPIEPNYIPTPTAVPQGPKSEIGKALTQSAAPVENIQGGGLDLNIRPTNEMGYGSRQLQKGIEQAAESIKEAPQKAMEMVSGEGEGLGSVAMLAASNGGAVHDLRDGGKVVPKDSTEKAKVKGDSYSNDTVPSLLSAEEVVLPRSVTQSAYPVKAAAEFMAQTMQKHKMAQGGPINVGPIDPNYQAAAQQDPQAMDPQSPAPVPAPPPQMAQAQAQPQAQQDFHLQGPLKPRDTKAWLMQQDRDWAEDLASGHVKPKTYADLFAKKDTMGKIGTLFGLLLSGAGSGLAKQENLVMKMMNDEITRDLDAQKISKENAMNFLRSNQAQQKQQVESGLTKAETRKIDDEVSKMQMNRAGFQILVDKFKNLTPGTPQYEMSQKALGLLGSQIDLQNGNIADLAAAQEALIGASQGKGGSDLGGEQEFAAISGNPKLKALSENRVSRSFPGLEGTADIPLTPKDRDEIESGINFQKQLERYKEWVKKHSLKGTVKKLSVADYQEGEALAQSMRNAFRIKSEGGVYTQGKSDFSKSLIPSPNTPFNGSLVLPKLEAVERDTAHELNNYLKSKGKSLSYKSKKEGSKKEPEKKGGLKEGQKGTSKSGKPIVVKNGKWTYSK